MRLSCSARMAGRVVRFLDGEAGQVVWGRVPDSVADPGAGQLLGMRLSLLEVTHHQQPLQLAAPRPGRTTSHTTALASLTFTELPGTAVVGQLLAPTPVHPAPAVWCVGLNYMKHWEEGAKKRGKEGATLVSIPAVGQALPTVPSSFLKPSSAVWHPGLPITVPSAGERGDRFSLAAGSNLHTMVDYEAELVIVMGEI